MQRSIAVCPAGSNHRYRGSVIVMYWTLWRRTMFRAGVRTYPLKEADLIVSFLTRGRRQVARGRQSRAPSEKRVGRGFGKAHAWKDFLFPAGDTGIGEAGSLRDNPFPFRIARR